MKKIIIVISGIILLGAVLYGIYNVFFKRNPEKIAEEQFGISLKEFNYTIDVFEEEWCANGDGYLIIIIRFANITKENMDYLKRFHFKSLPVAYAEYLQMVPNRIPDRFFEADKGYYMYQPGRIKDMEEIIGIKGYTALDFKVLIIDTERNRAVLYYQIM